MPTAGLRRLAARLGAAALLAGASASAFAADAVKDAEMEAAFARAAASYRGSSSDSAAAVGAFQRFLAAYPRGDRTGDAYFAVGESLFQAALDDAQRRDSSAPGGVQFERLPDSSVGGLRAAKQDYAKALEYASDDALRADAAYRLGEISYDLQDWDAAGKAFASVAKKWPGSGAAPFALLGLAYTDLARRDFKGAAAAVSDVASDAPDLTGVPDLAFIRGLLALHSGSFSRAEELLSGNDDPRARYFLGRTYLLWKKPLLAAALFEKTAQDSSRPGLREAASFYLGDSFFVSHDYDGAVAKYQAFVQDFPFSRFKVAALYRTGGAAFEQGDYGQARLSFGALAAQDPDGFYAAYARYFIGESYLASGDFRQALFAYSDLLSSHGGLLKPEALYRLTWTEASLGDFGRAAQSAEEFMDRYSTSPLADDVSMVQAESLVRLKRDPEALAAYQRVVDSSPGSAVAEEALFLMLKLQYDRGDYGSILTSYQFLLNQLPESRSRWRSLSRLVIAEAYLRTGRLDVARGLYRMIVKVYPNSPAAVYAQDGLAWCDELAGRPKEAVAERRTLEDMLNSSTSTLAAINQLGIADSLYAQKDYDAALTLYQGFASAQPGSPAVPEALYRAGISLYHLGYYSEAVKTWQDLLSKAPDSPEAEKASFNLADTLFRAQKYPEARTAYQDILARWPRRATSGLCYLRLAQIAFQTQDDDGTLAEVKALLVNLPGSGSVSAALDLAEAVFDRDPKENFRDYFSGLIQNAPESPAAAAVEMRLADRLYAKKDYADAAREFERFSVDYTDAPDLSRAQLYLGECYFDLGRYADAAAAYGRFAANFPQSSDVPAALFKMGSADYNLKKYGPAAAAYEKVIDSYAGSAYLKPALYNLALAYRDAGSADQAEEVYQKYLAASPGPAQGLQARWDLFSIEEGRRDYPDALKTLAAISTSAAAGSDAAMEAAYRTGEVRRKMQDEDGAERAWEAMIPMRPAGSPFRLQALIELSKIYEKNSDWKRAIPVYEDLARNASSAAIAQAARKRIEQIRVLNTASAGSVKGAKQ
jgi:TolA-binding protein